MTDTIYLEILKENCNLLQRSVDTLESSFRNCTGINESIVLSDEQFIQLEALAARFSRTVDILTKQVLRTLDMIEYGEAGTLIDILNHSEKRDLLPIDHKVMAMKQLRNQIAHEYFIDAQKVIYLIVIKYTPDLIQYCNSALNYSTKYL